jgi:hypothetical protein
VRFLGQGVSFSPVFLGLALLFSQGCARPVLQTFPASDIEIVAVEKAFVRFQEVGGQLCSPCLDAEADVALSVAGWFGDHTGKFYGYLQAMQPGYIKFVTLNPLGQPLFIFVTDGRLFKGFNVFAGKAYLGSVLSRTYREYAPPGLVPEYSYYWLTGRLEPGEPEIRAVMRDREPGKFWLQIHSANENSDSMVLFDPEDLTILRRVFLNGQGEHLADIRYGDYRVLSGPAETSAGNATRNPADPDEDRQPCKVPASISVSSRTAAGQIDIKLSAFLEDALLSAEDFHLAVPENFEQLLVK